MKCGRCGEREATRELTSIPMHGGTPYCERCIVEVQLDHARERAEAIPELERRLADEGGPAARIICGYVYGKEDGDPFPFNELCTLPYGHLGFHARA